MANAVFSPRDFKAWIIEEDTPGTSPAITSGLYQLDVDSVAFPSLSPNQVTAVRSRGGRVIHKDDFFQDNEMRAIEVSLSGTFRKDIGTVMLMQSVAGMDLNNAVADVTLGATPTGQSGAYGDTGSDGNNKTFSLVLASPDTADGYNIIMKGCLCTSFSINADMTADGGLYKFEATISSGQNPETNNTATEAGTVFGNDLITLTTLDSASAKLAGVSAPVISSFAITIESPAVYTGFSSTGYHSYSRGSEFTVTANSTVKYDSVTRGLYDSLNTQTSEIGSDLFIMPQANPRDCSVSLPIGFLTDVAFNEGDAMMLDVSVQGASDGSANILSFDLA
tara:strand:- start:451 stop:1458 length:1008 start_codon:yes stop_codon:yes gene_type:complete